MSGATKFNAGEIFPQSHSAPFQGQACVFQELQPEGVPGRPSGSAPHVAGGLAGLGCGGGGRGLAEPTQSLCPRCCELGRLQPWLGSQTTHPGDSARVSPTQQGLHLGWLGDLLFSSLTAIRLIYIWQNSPF